jgi:hypothetical protein
VRQWRLTGNSRRLSSHVPATAQQAMPVVRESPRGRKQQLYTVLASVPVFFSESFSSCSIDIAMPCSDLQR